MRYAISQLTRYAYDSPVARAQHSLRLMPRAWPGQLLFGGELKTAPAPDENHGGEDFFGNPVRWISIENSHAEFSVRNRLIVQVEPPEPPLAALTPAWEEVRAAALASTDFGPLAPAHMLGTSRRVTPWAAITDFTQPFFPPGRPILEAADALNQALHALLRYVPGSTDAATPPNAAFAAKRGVCQDFAQIMIAGLRGLGLPAAYISGYLRTQPPPGKKRLVGADATHAWAALWCGDAVGWIGLDPTNAMRAGADHIVLAYGRDYADVAPVDGVIIAAGSHSLKVEVDVVPVAG
jgi:transglutaminase-like putative cysteine protease